MHLSSDGSSNAAGPVVPVGRDGLYMRALVDVFVALGPPADDGASTGPWATVTVLVDNEGRPNVHRIVLTAVHPALQGDDIGRVDYAPITDADLRALSIEQAVRGAIEVWAGDQPTPDPTGPEPEAAAVDAAVVQGRRRRRNETTPVRLRAVAMAYRAGREQGGDHQAGVAEVRRRMHVSSPQAYRLVARARQDRYITDDNT